MSYVSNLRDLLFAMLKIKGSFSGRSQFSHLWQRRQWKEWHGKWWGCRCFSLRAARNPADLRHPQPISCFSEDENSFHAPSLSCSVWECKAALLNGRVAKAGWRRPLSEAIHIFFGDSGYLRVQAHAKHNRYHASWLMTLSWCGEG